jgi:hypothetical protein
MTFAAAAGYGIAIYIATTVLIELSSVARLPVVVRSSARRTPQREPSVQWAFLVRNDIR